jgi:ABC-2 type transport system permease protein
MRLSKAWIVAARDFKIFRRVKNVWISIIIFPVVISVLFPTILEYLTFRGNHGLAAPAVLPNLLTSFSFFLVIGAAYVPLGIATYSIVGEKVEKSLEPLLATPLTDGEILLGKAISAIIPTLVAMYAAAAVFMMGIDEVTHTTLGYYYFPNWNIATLLLVLMPVAIVMSVLFSVIVSSRVNDVRSANSFGIFVLFPLLGIYLLSETSVITLDVNTLLIISGVLLAVDVALFFVGTKTFRREEILTKWK